MSRLVDHKQLVAREEIVASPAIAPDRFCADRTFELPPAIHIATGVLFLGFVSVLCAAFATPGLLVPYAIFAIFIVAYFAVPAMWARMKPQENRSRALGWYEFLDQGITTGSGHAGGAEGAVLVLMLPIFVFCWSIAIAIIAAFVR